jgi:hypothetical protein
MEDYRFSNIRKNYHPTGRGHLETHFSEHFNSEVTPEGLTLSLNSIKLK